MHIQMPLFLIIIFKSIRFWGNSYSGRNALYHGNNDIIYQIHVSQLCKLLPLTNIKILLVPFSK